MKYFGVLLLAAASFAHPLHQNVQCGTPTIKPDTSTTLNIQGGKDAVPFSWPWQIALNIKSSHSLTCGGTLISPTWVLTAAHCMDKPASNYEVLLGAYNRTMKEEGTVTVGVTEYFIHPKNNPKTHEYDFALLHLSKSIEYTDHIAPVCLPAKQDEPLPADGTTIFVTGWGQTERFGPTDPTLQQVYQPIATEKCKAKHPGQIYDSNFCAGFETGGKGHCFGDSGGPAVVEVTNGTFTQVGIVLGTWVTLSTCVKDYSVFTRVSAGIDFIKEHVTDL